jgi:transposase-like protein
MPDDIFTRVLARRPTRGAAASESPESTLDDLIALRQAGHSYREIAQRTGISSSALKRQLRQHSPRTRSPWLQQDDDMLTLLVQSGASVGEMRRALNRDESALYKRAVHLGIGVGCPPETELAQTAARRSGFAASAFARIMEWAEVKAGKSFSRGAGRKCYEVANVDEAVARWLRTETVNAAALRLGVPTSTLLRWLREEGILPTGRLSRTMHRVESALLERVVQARGVRVR